MMHIENVLLLWFTIFLIKKPLQAVALKMKLSKIKSLQMNFINHLLENIKKETYSHHSNTIFGCSFT